MPKYLRVIPCLALVLAACMFFSAALEHREAGEATDICSVALSGGTRLDYLLLDGSRLTRYEGAGAEELTFASEEPVYQFYIVWDRPPGPWSLNPSQGGGMALGQYDFIHEYVMLESPCDSFTLTMPQSPYALCDIYAFGEGEPPDWVQRWQPPLERAELLVLPTHADDEHLFFGGTLPYYAGELGMDVQVCYLTNHWGEPYRPHELLNGLWEVGVTHYPVISGFVDMYSDSLSHAESLYGREAFVEYITGLLRRFRPYAVIGHDLNGEYGHGVHMLGAHALLDAAKAGGDPEAFSESAGLYGVWEVPKVYLHLYPEGEIIMDWDMELPSFGKSAYEAASDGYARHISQHGYFQMERWGRYDCRKFGLAHTLVGPDVEKNDFFENIVMEPEPEPEPASRVDAGADIPPPASFSVEASAAPPRVEVPAPADSSPPERRATAGTYIILGISGFLVFLSAIITMKKFRK